MLQRRWANRYQLQAPALRLRDVAMAEAEDANGTTNLTSEASGMSTPRPLSEDLETVVDDVAKYLGHLEGSGQRLVAQMIAQEVARLMQFHHCGRTRWALQAVHEVSEEYLRPDFEVGVVFAPMEGRWMAELIARCGRVHTTDEQMPQHDESHLMERARTRGRRTEDSRRRQRSRSPRHDPPWRQPEAVASRVSRGYGEVSLASEKMLQVLTLISTTLRP